MARSIGIFAFLAALALGSVEADVSTKVVSRLRGRSSEKSAGLEEVISVLIKMMDEFRGLASDDKDNWEEWSENADESEADKNEYIRDQEALVMQNTGLESSKKETVSKLTKEIQGLGSDLMDTRKSIKELTTLRQEEHEQHEAALIDLTKTIESVNKAIEILEGHYAVSGASLSEIKNRVQYAMSLAGVDSKPAKALTNFMQSAGPDWLSVDGSKYNTYEKQGGAGGVVGTLNDLRATLDQNKQDMIETENTRRREFEETKSAKEGEVRRINGESSDKGDAKMRAQAAIVTAQATISTATKNKDDAVLYLATLKSDREKFQAEYQERTRMRDDEMAATQAALDALQAVSAGAKEGVGLLQLPPPPPTCTQCRAQAKRLLSLSKKMHSEVLAQVAEVMSQRSHGDYDQGKFGPVVDLLRALVERLEAEQSSETSHHEWCETEKGQSVSAKEERDHTIKALQGEIERLTISTATLKTEITFLMGELSRVKKENSDATSNRNSAHDVFTKSKADHDEVIDALNKAITALEGKYGLVQVRSKTTKRAVSFLQELKKVSQSPFADYQSGGASGGSALMMLQDLLSRYTEARTQLVNDEDSAVTVFKALMKVNKQFIVDTTNTKNAKLAERRGKVQELKDDKEEMKSAFTELQELATYLQELRPKCDDIRSTFEERKRRRDAEISALKECLDVLSDPSSMGGM